MSWLMLILALFGAYFAHNIYHLQRNYRAARKSGLHAIVLPISSLNTLFMIISVPLRPVLQRCLPKQWYDAMHLVIYGYEIRCKQSVVQTMGTKVWALSMYSHNEVTVCDPELAVEILKNPSEFPNPDISGRIIGFFGSNLLITNGETWARQRKLIAPNINERISRLVFGESCRQAREMLACYVDEFQGVTNETLSGMKTVAINVLGAAGFGVSQPWKGEKTTTTSTTSSSSSSSSSERGYRTTYMEASKAVVENIIISALVPKWLLMSPLFSPAWQQLGHAKNEFPLHTKDMMENERRVQAEATEPRSNLLSMLVRLADANKNHDSSGSKTAQFLSEDEIIGNLFIFTSAGFDTTANTMAYALALLATYPQWQDWLYEEISHVVGDRDTADLDYPEVFPRLPRCLALMLETMRLFPPLVHLAKSTVKTHDVSVTTSSGKSYQIPRGSIVHINTVAIHRAPETWGPNSDAFNPARWLIDSSLAPSAPSATITANIKTMAKGTFLPWSMGPRVCPGMKMSQVEFVSVFMTVFARYRVEAVRLHDAETDDQVRTRLEAIMDDSQPLLTLQMARNQDLKVKWTKR